MLEKAHGLDSSGRCAQCWPSLQSAGVAHYRFERRSIMRLNIVSILQRENEMKKLLSKSLSVRIQTRAAMDGMRKC